MLCTLFIMIPLYNYTVAVIGFVNTALSITEDGGDLEFEIAVRRGTLRFDVLVDFATANGAALGISHYIYNNSLHDCNFQVK